jgi:hypothetical protein
VPVRGKCIASHELRGESGVPPSEIGTLRPTKAGAQVLRQVESTGGEIETSFKWWLVAPLVTHVSHSIVEGGYQADCYKLLTSCILASISERAHSM